MSASRYFASCHTSFTIASKVYFIWLHPSFLSHEVRVHYKKKFNRTDRKSTCPRLHLIPMEYTPWNFIKFEVNFSWLKKKTPGKTYL